MLDPFDRAEQQYYTEPNPQEIGRCYICGWEVYKFSGDFMSDGLRHFDCKPLEVDEDGI
jgi:hypothetical protein